MGMSGLAADRATIRSLLSDRLFCRVLGAQFATAMVVYSLNLAGVMLVEERTHSSVQTGAVILSSILPAFLASLLAGAVVDRRGQVEVLVASYLTLGLVAVAFWGGARQSSPGLILAVICLANAGAATLTQFALTGQLALLPDLVEKPHLMTANTLFQVSMVAAEGLGIALLGPVVIKLAGFSAVGMVGALLCLVALAFVATLPRRRPGVSPGQGKASPWRAVAADLQAGWQTVVHDRLLRLVVIQITLAGVLLLVLLALAPGLVFRDLGLDFEEVPFLALAGGLGFLLGAILMGHWERRLSRPAWIAVGLGAFGLGVGLVGLLSGKATHQHGWPMAPLILGAGLGLALVIIPARTVLQEHPPPALRGRVIAVQLALANAASVVSILVGGGLADQVGIRPVMGMLGVLAMGVSAVSLHYARG
jgi:MFS family permease